MFRYVPGTSDVSRSLKPIFIVVFYNAYNRQKTADVLIICKMDNVCQYYTNILYIYIHIVCYSIFMLSLTLVTTILTI